MDATVVALLCRTSDRGPGCARGAAALAPLLGDARVVGCLDAPRAGDWADDLRDARDCLRNAENFAAEALSAGHFPVLCAGDCTISLATLPAVAHAHPGARVVWLDAHGDFNTPDTTTSGFLGGMCLAGACGRWPTGFDGAVDPARVLVVGSRDLDELEERELDAAGVVRLDATADVARAVAGDEVYVHLDLDVLDPSVMPAQFPAASGLDFSELEGLLAAIAGAAARIVGVEITCFDAPEDDDRRAALATSIAAAVAPLLPAA